MSDDTSPDRLVPEGYEDVPFIAVRLKARRKAIARNLEASSRVPSLTADMQMDLTQLMACRKEWNDGAGRVAEDRLSIMAFVARAAIATLEEYPHMNATYTETSILQWHPVNLGVAVDAGGGLIVPVIRDAQNLGVDSIGRAVRDLAERARAGTLTLDDLVQGTFTLSNPGAVGPSLRAEALLNTPQVCLLGLPGIRRIPVVVGAGDDETIQIRPVLCPSLTFDHRAIDGGEAVRYLSSLTQRVEGWELQDYLTVPSGPS